jgi:Phosphoribosylformylglycinamidine (FGAM) synthase, synthetase domain
VRNQIFAITDCAEGGLFLSCHDISDGGIATSIAEMTFRKNIGCLVKIPGDLQDHKILFSETGGFVIETKKGNTENVMKVFKAHGLNVSKIGKTGGEYVQLNETIKVKVGEAKHRWENGLREKL